jgi:hypothetical protein
VDAVVVPEAVPVLGCVEAGVAENASAALHALLEFDRKREQGCLGKIERGESAMGEGDVDGALRLAGVPMLAGGDDGKQTADQLAGARGIFKVKEEIARERHVVAAQDKALDVGLVELTHCVRQS